MFLKQRKKFYQQLGGDDTKTYQQPDAKETERFWTKIWQPKKKKKQKKQKQKKNHNEKTEWINNITRELEGLEKGLKAEIHFDLLKTILKKYQTGKRQAMVSGSRNSPPFTTDWN